MTLFLVDRAEHAHRVLALQAKARMHQLIRQFARTREKQQTFGIQIEPPDRLPLALLQTRQLAEHRRTVLWIVVRHHFTDRLVVRDDARRRWRDAIADRLAVDLDLIAMLNTLADMRGLGVDRNPTLQDQRFHLKTRTKASLGQHLVQLGRIRFG